MANVNMTDMRGPINAVIFDFGGVLMRTESQTPRIRMATRYGMTIGELTALVFDSPDNHLVELGKLSTAQHWSRISESLCRHQSGDPEVLRREFFSGDALDLALMRYISALRSLCKTALLSNAGEALLDQIADLGIASCFDAVIVSAAVGVRKPSPEIFQIALSSVGVEPDRTAFVDDSGPNIAAATALGMHAIRFTTRQDTITQLNQLLHSHCHRDGGPA